MVLEGNAREEEGGQGRQAIGPSHHGTRRINKKRLTQSSGANHFLLLISADSDSFLISPTHFLIKIYHISCQITNYIYLYTISECMPDLVEVVECEIYSPGRLLIAANTSAPWFLWQALVTKKHTVVTDSILYAATTERDKMIKNFMI
jgi:hypothetical protein